MSTIKFLKTRCPTMWGLLDQQAKGNLPNGIQKFLSCKWAAEGRRQLELADKSIAILIARTSEKLVGDTYRRDLSGVDTENQLAELLCEVHLLAA